MEELVQGKLKQKNNSIGELVPRYVDFRSVFHSIMLVRCELGRNWNISGPKKSIYFHEKTKKGDNDVGDKIMLATFIRYVRATLILATRRFR